MTLTSILRSEPCVMAVLVLAVALCIVLVADIVGEDMR